MASLLFSFPTIFCHRRSSCSLAPSPVHNYVTTNSVSFGVPAASCKLNFHHSFHYRPTYWSGRCLAAGSPSEPPPENHRPSSSGVTTTITRFKDTLQVFFAVLFWMSLFFWSSAWDGGNSGRPNKRTGSRK